MKRVCGNKELTVHWCAANEKEGFFSHARTGDKPLVNGTWTAGRSKFHSSIGSHMVLLVRASGGTFWGYEFGVFAREINLLASSPA